MFGGMNTNNSNRLADTWELDDTWTLGFTQLVAGEACSSGIDYDRDGKVGCADDECWSVCKPACPPESTAASCLASPACGDGICTLVEDCRSCPADCATATTACPLTCGDFFCDPTETLASCPGDCP